MELLEALILMFLGSVLLSAGVFLGAAISYVADQRNDVISRSDMYWDGDDLVDVELAMNNYNLGLEERTNVVRDILRSRVRTEP